MKTVRLASATTSPTLFLAKQQYLPSSVTLTPWICSQPVTSYFWGPPLNCKKGAFLSALEAEARGIQCHRSPVSAGSEVPGLLWHQPCSFLFTPE